MATLSTLELMLEEIQKQDREDADNVDESPPALPPRPVSKARPPPGRARRAKLPFHNQETVGCKKVEEVVMSKRTKREAFGYVEAANVCQQNYDVKDSLAACKYRDDGGGPFFPKIKIDNGTDERTVKGIIGIQKCFRGYKARYNYHQLKEVIIALQSFIRGENARRKFRRSGERQTSVVLVQNQQKVVWRNAGSREAAIIYLQAVVRGWLSRKHSRYMKKETTENTKEANHPYKSDSQSEDHVAVPYSYILDLEQRVLRTEAALRNKKQENTTLQLQIQRIETKWQLHEAKMKSMEKMWQDEFASIQASLALARERRTKETVPRRPQECQKGNYTIKHILEREETCIHDIDSSFRMGDDLDYIPYPRRCAKEELRRLKGRFKAWKKDFQAQLSEIKVTVDRIDSSRVKTFRKGWCVR